MPSINMIAARRAEKRRQEKNTQKLIYGILGEFGTVLIISSFMVAHLVQTHNRVAVLDDQIKVLQTKVDEIQRLQDETAALEPKVAALAQAKKDTLYWYTAFNNISSSLPNGTWLTSMGSAGNASSDGDAGGKLNLSGLASSQFVVGETMLRMNTFPTIGSVTLNNVAQSTYGTRPVVNFQMVVQLKPAAATVTGGASNVQKS